MRATEQRLKSIVIDRLGVEDSEVSRDANFIEDLDADSLDIAILVADVEKEFSIRMPDADVDKIHTFGEAVDYINLFPESKDYGKE
ncbi:MAG: acyl carrier protein [Bacteroidales bacterium]|nr:acyl carrier protein [Bacteroidales bacterium]